MNIQLNAVLVSVDYADILSITLPYNRRHFNHVTVVTTPEDKATINTAVRNGARTYETHLFYADGADFNKWRALEAALDFWGRDGWLCLMDADVLWPKQAQLPELEIGNLYSPLRHMLLEPDPNNLPPESKWGHYPLHPQQREWAGFTQIFHGDDPALGDPPWHQTDWKHAGGADSFFQQRWSDSNKIRLPWNVLHLGPGGSNWCGRTTPDLTDGSRPPQAPQRTARLQGYLAARRRNRGFTDERLASTDV